MSQQVFDIDTVGFGAELGNYFDFHINNTFYLLAPDYYFSFYSIYLKWNPPWDLLIPLQTLEIVLLSNFNCLAASAAELK